MGMEGKGGGKRRSAENPDKGERGRREGEEERYRTAQTSMTYQKFVGLSDGSDVDDSSDLESWLRPASDPASEAEAPKAEITQEGTTSVVVDDANKESMDEGFTP